MSTAAGSMFDPENYASGGFLDDVDVTITAAKVITGEDTPFDDASDRTFIKVTMQPDDEGSEARDEYYGVGSLDKFSPSKDGSRIVCEPGTKLNKNTKAALFFAALVNAGFPKSDFPGDNNVTFLVGLRGHVNAVPMPEMKGGKDNGKYQKKEGSRPPTVVVVTRLLGEATTTAAPGKPKARAAAAKPAAAAKAAPAVAAAAPAAGTDVGAAVEAAIVAIIGQNGVAQKRLLPTEMLQRLKDVPTRTASFKLIGDAAWLGDEARPWTFDAGSGELQPNEATAALLAQG